MIHYHGTPLTPRRELQKMAGKHFCVSFARPDDADWCLAHGQSIMWDNGAFTAFTQGKQFDLMGYYSFLESRLGHPHWGVVPDVIGGDMDQQRILLQSWPFRRSLGAPVWHLDKPIDYLLELADGWERICFGSAGEYWQVGSDKWCRRIDAAFNALASRHDTLPWVHMLRGLALAGDYFPFASADSTNVARNFKCQRTCPERMARRLDSVQNPLGWTLRPEQMELIT